MKFRSLATLGLFSLLALAGCRNTEDLSQIQLAPLEERLPDDMVENFATAYGLTPQQWAQLRGVTAPFIDLTEYQDVDVEEIPSDPLELEQVAGMPFEAPVVDVVEGNPVMPVDIIGDSMIQVVEPDPQYADLLTDQIAGEKHGPGLGDDESADEDDGSITDFSIAGENEWSVSLADEQDEDGLYDEGSVAIIHDAEETPAANDGDPDSIRRIYEYNEAIHRESEPRLVETISRIAALAGFAMAAAVIMFVIRYLLAYTNAPDESLSQMKAARNAKKQAKARARKEAAESAQQKNEAQEEDVMQPLKPKSVTVGVADEAAMRLYEQEMEKKREAEQEAERAEMEKEAERQAERERSRLDSISSSKEILVNEPPYNMLDGREP